MSMKSPKSRRALELAPMVFGVLLLSLVASSCDSLFGDDEAPEIARLLLDVDPGVTVTLVTSNDFTEVIDEDGGDSYYDLQSADTTTVTGTLDQTYSLGSQVKFHSEATGTGDGYFSMTVFIDGEEKYTRVQEADGTPISFTYRFWQ
jgi:hypothetical protein